MHYSTLPVRIQINMAISKEQETRRRLEETFSKGAIKVLELSNQEAQALEHNYVGTEHIFLALTKDNQAREALIFMKVNPDEVAQKVKDTLKITYRPVDKKFGLNPRAEEVINLAINESKNRNRGGKTRVTSVDILVGVIKLGRGTPYLVLNDLGVNKNTLSKPQIARGLKKLRDQSG